MNFGGTIRLNRIGICIVIGACILLVLYINTNGIESPKTEPRKSASRPTINLKNILVASIEAAIYGGKEVVSIRKATDIGEKSKGNTKEGVNDPVTKADYNSHCVMFHKLKHSFPEVKIISEETIAESDCTNLKFHGDELNIIQTDALSDDFISVDDITVWIDPLDATKEFTENLLTYVTTMVCVAVKGKPIIGIVHKPFENEPQTYWAWKGKGTSDNLKTKGASTASKRIIVSISHAGAVKNISEQAFGKNIEIITAAGAGYKSLEVASGKVDAYIHTTAIKKWDVCAGNAIINELGGKMTTLSNEELDYSSGTNVLNDKGLLATMNNHEWYLEKLKAVGKV